MITKNLKVGDRFIYKSSYLTFEAICTYSEEGDYKETITKQGTSSWKAGTKNISSSEEENDVITLLKNETELKNFKFKSKNHKSMETTIKKL